MRQRRTRSVISLCAALMLLLAALPATAQETNDRRLKPGEQDAVGAAWLDDLRGYYASGDPADLPAMTPSGLEEMRAHDWRFGVVEAGLATFRESWDIVESTQWDEVLVDGEHVSIDLRIFIDVAQLAETLDGETGRPVEMTDGIGRRAFNATLVRGSGTDDWRLDGIGPPAGRNRFFFESAPVVACPGLKDPRVASDPFKMRPWCTANGEGRKLRVGPLTQRSEIAPALSFPSSTGCGWDDALFVDIGWPPGEPLDSTDGVAHRYVRDPAREVPGAKRYSRSAKPPRDAISTGVTNGYATIWTSRKLGEDAILVQVGDRFERWPQSGAGCTGN